jgi:acetyl-CoA carboxylase biotin carboxyl carrier protein
MEYKEIRDLAVLMKEMGLTRLDFKGGDGATVRMERAVAGLPATIAPAVISAERLDERPEEPVAAGVFTVRSPMVGVFYSSPGADKEPYVSVGDVVQAGEVLCIIEAMKIMNEITAERDGVISEICVNNKDVVEYGQPMFHIDTVASRD